MDETGESIGTLFIASCMTGRVAGLREILEQHPDVAATDIWTAAAWGDADAVARFLDADPEALHAAGGPSGWNALLHAAYSRAHHVDEDREDPLEETVRLLLARGADPDTCWPQRADSATHRRPALFGAAAVADHPGVARALLEGGATVNDGESLYHAAQHFHAECLEVLREFGADVNGEGTPFGTTPLGFIVDSWDPSIADAQYEGMNWLMDRGADPDLPSGERLETPLHLAARKSPDPGLVHLLLERGASLDTIDRDERTPRDVAWLHGRAALADMLHETGEPPLDLDDPAMLVAACCRGDAGEVDVFLRENPALAVAVSERDREVLVQMAEEHNRRAVELLLQAGLDPAARGRDGGTALHHAAFLGDLPLVRVILPFHPPLEQRCRVHEATPLHWAQHASAFRPSPGGTYPEVVQTLLMAGSVPVDDIGSPAVQAVLQSHRS